MTEDLQLRGYSESTQTLYVAAVRQLCEHFDKYPGKITEKNLRDYFLYGKNIKKMMIKCRLQCFFAYSR